VARETASTALGRAIAACRRHLAYAAGFSALLNLLFIVPMLYMLQVYDRVVPTQGKTTLFFLTIVLLLGLVTLSILDHARSRLLVRSGARLDRLLGAAVVDASFSNARDQQAQGSRQSLQALDSLRQTLSGPAVLAVFDIPWTPIYIMLGALVHPYIGILTLIGALVLAVIGWRNERATRERLRQAAETAGRTYAGHNSAMASSDVVRALGMRQALVTDLLDQRSTMLALQTNASLAGSGWSSASKFVRLLLQSLALGLGALLAISESISVGAIFAATFLVGRALAPIDQVVGAWRQIVDARDAYRSLTGLLEAQAVQGELTELPRPEGRLSVEDLTVVSAASGTPILDKVAFSVSAGSVIGIIGPSGAGKSTLARVIAGALPPDEGGVRFDGARQQDWDPERLAQYVGYLPQETALFAGTIKDNISRFRARLGEDAAEIDAAAIKAAQLAGAHDLILKLPGGYDYALGFGGRGLSAGQAQRVALARAVFADPAYLVLDEPNSHLDAEGDLQLVKTIGELKKRGTTVLVVAHKLSVLPVVDRLLLLRGGRLELYGPRDEVLSRVKAASGPRAVARPKEA
jgi:ATP-binding cassette subfamily C protein